MGKHVWLANASKKLKEDSNLAAKCWHLVTQLWILGLVTVCWAEGGSAVRLVRAAFGPLWC